MQPDLFSYRDMYTVFKFDSWSLGLKVFSDSYWEFLMTYLNHRLTCYLINVFKIHMTIGFEDTKYFIHFSFPCMFKPKWNTIKLATVIQRVVYFDHMQICFCYLWLKGILYSMCCKLYLVSSKNKAEQFIKNVSLVLAFEQ